MPDGRVNMLKEHQESRDWMVKSWKEADLKRKGIVYMKQSMDLQKELWLANIQRFEEIQKMVLGKTNSSSFFLPDTNLSLICWDY